MKNPYSMDDHLAPDGRMDEIVGEGEGAAGCFGMIEDFAVKASWVLLGSGLAVLVGVALAATAVQA